MKGTDPQPAVTLTQRAARGAAWALVGRGLHQGLGVVLSLLFLGLLLPEHYGLIALGMVLVYVAGDVRDLRFADALIQRKELRTEHIRSAFSIQVGTGLLLSGVLAGLSPLLGRFYNAPELVLVAAALALRPFLDSLGDVSYALLVRRMAFGRVALSNVLSLALSGALAVWLAVAGWGVWALVALNIAGSVVRSAVLIACARWLPVPGWSWSAVREMWRFSMFLYGARFLGQLSRNVDKVIVGRILGDAAVGVYSLGFRLMMLPLEKIAWEVGRVMLSTLSKIQDDLERFRGAYLRAVAVLSLITFPVTAGLCVTAGEFVGAVAKPEWQLAGTVTVIRLFCLAGLVESVATTVGWIFFVRGRTDWQFAWNFVPLAATVAAVIIGVRYGVKGVAAAYLVRTTLLAVPAFGVSFRLIGLRLGSLFRALSATALATAVMAAAVLAVRAALIAHAALPAWSLLVIEAGVGVAVYLGLLWLTKPAVWREAIDLLRGFLARKNPSAPARENGT